MTSINGEVWNGKPKALVITVGKANCRSKVMNLEVLQRLRGIRQLALESLVYPGALHNSL